jgi:hypothetical protein
MNAVHRRVMLGLGVLVTGYANAATVEVRSTIVEGVRLVSAELVRDTASSAQTLVVRLGNYGAAIGQAVHVTTVVRDANGDAKGGGATRVTVQAQPGSEESIAVPLDQRWLDGGESVIVDLARIDADDSRGADSCVADSGGPCPACDWCASAAVLLCGEGNVRSMDCSCETASCSVTCGS